MPPKSQVLSAHNQTAEVVGHRPSCARLVAYVPPEEVERHFKDLRFEERTLKAMKRVLDEEGLVITYAGHDHLRLD